MIEHKPITTLAEYDAINEQECMEGYIDGREDAREPGDNHSRSYWHGWRMAQMDAKRMAIPDEHRALVHLVVRRMRMQKERRN